MISIYSLNAEKKEGQLGMLHLGTHFMSGLFLILLMHRFYWRDFNAASLLFHYTFKEPKYEFVTVHQKLQGRWYTTWRSLKMLTFFWVGSELIAWNSSFSSKLYISSAIKSQMSLVLLLSSDKLGRQLLLSVIFWKIITTLKSDMMCYI